jgi:hypothetical protein
MDTDLIKTFKKNLVTAITKINRKLKTNKLINFEHLLYSLCLMNGNDESYDSALLKLKNKKILNVSKTALIKSRLNTDDIYFQYVNDNLLDNIYKKDEPKIIAVDGTHVQLPYELIKYGFKSNKKKTYCSAIISVLFDVEKKIPINYILSKNKNERDALLMQTIYINKNDIVIADRGYFSYPLLSTLTEKGIKFIFRLKDNSYNFLIDDETNDYTAENVNQSNINLRIITYYVDKKKYILGTTIFDKNIKYFTDLYWKRWGVEIHFRHSKYDLSLKRLESKTEKTLLQDIAIHNFIFIISSYFQNMSESNIKPGYKINTACHLNMTINEVLFHLLFKNNTVKNNEEIMRLFNNAKAKLVQIKKNRSYPRLAIRPGSRWRIYLGAN